jgi:hypothetical protein
MIAHRRLGRLAAAGAALLSVSARADDPPPWPDSFTGRLEVLALMRTLQAEILAGTSATLSLEDWCRDHRLAADPKVSAELVPGAAKPATAEQRRLLEVAPDEPIAYRRVRLGCGGLVLSVAENWYVPARLTAEMNRALALTDTPFGIVVRPLGPYRQPLSASLLWSPLPEGWETAPVAASAVPAGTGLAIPEALFEHRALLRDGSHRPFSLVDEVYRRDLLRFAPPGVR